VGDFLRDEMPGFTLDDRTDIPPGCRLFFWRASDKLWWYVFLMLRQDRDWFRLQLMWSSRGGFPSRFAGLPWPPEENTLIAFGHLGLPAGTKLISIDGGHDASPVRAPTGPNDVTWLDPLPLEEARKNANAALDGDFEDMRKFGVPYIMSVSKERGEAPDFGAVFGTPL
jgi:hypothetical protein